MLAPLYRLRFKYPESWGVELEGGWERWFFFAEGTVEGSIKGRFRGANFPMRRGEAGTFMPDFRAVIETDDDATILLEWHGYGRSYPVGRRQIVGTILHSSDRQPYSRLNDIVCVTAGEVRSAPEGSDDGPTLVVDVAELVWEPIGE